MKKLSGAVLVLCVVIQLQPSWLQGESFFIKTAHYVRFGWRKKFGRAFGSVFCYQDESV